MSEQIYLLTLRVPFFESIVLFMLITNLQKRRVTHILLGSYRLLNTTRIDIVSNNAECKWQVTERWTLTCWTHLAPLLRYENLKITLDLSREIISDDNIKYYKCTFIIDIYDFEVSTTWRNCKV